MKNIFRELPAAPDPQDIDYHELWRVVVRQYSMRKLTKPDDKLVAISAVAKQMQKCLGTGGEYIAGL